MRRTLGITAAALITAITLMFVSAHHVVGEDMAPSILPGDWVWIVPGLEVQPGDVVALRDPLDTSRTVLRRTLAGPGQTFSYSDGQIRVNKRTLRKQSMGDMDRYQVTQETMWAKAPNKGNQWLTRAVADPAVLWSSETVTVPEDAWFLVADDRDRSLDSRWWGHVPSSAILGVVRLRIGHGHTWRTSVEWMMGTPPMGD